MKNMKTMNAETDTRNLYSLNCAFTEKYTIPGSIINVHGSKRNNCSIRNAGLLTFAS